ncbi:sirohydrochlorin cobaltochelatase [Deferribacter desulfuricans SSM1]|uniref:Sirohydrochlorin cobaltochelatase n=1 Tax=Deferribacter desulfuricans (strain DSM 14783 / JCM 11476 / NBRC 101012 / SSM1) TaxID=639282 RepID=D3P9W9_DEFDS|nr:sirohydrochlorin cobaltochelatase [Deferribacter desulfuricans]BAI81509.1 sirohydrochlorin cobaltochelatase [Deferribacter desulfuricans SSM1]
MKKVIIFLFVAVFLMTGVCMAKMEKNKTKKNAIVIASFGTTYPSGLKSIINIINMVKNEFPNTEVRVTFTSNIIRKIWQKRNKHPEEWIKKGVPKEILNVKGVVATLGDLSDEGYKNIVIQPTHIYHGEEFSDLLEYARGLNSIQTIKKRWKPFHKIVLGRPALGTYGDKYDYHEDIKEVVKALRNDVELARKHNAALVYMGHGNEFYSTGAYIETEKEFNRQYKDVKIFIGTVEGYPSLGDVILKLKKQNIKKVVLKPFMVVAGDHASNDMAGDEPDSWKNILKKEGIEVIPVIEGLGSNNSFAKIFLEHLKDAAKDGGINLK